MDILKLKLSLEGIESPEVALVDLQKWLENAGVRFELERGQPTEEELAAGKVVAGILILALLNESIGEALHGVDGWQQQHPKARPVLHLTGKPQQDDPIREEVQHKNLHIELREPEWPLRGTEPHKDKGK